MTMGELSENLQYFLKLQKQRNKQKTFRPFTFKFHFFLILLFFLNNLKSYGSVI